MCREESPLILNHPIHRELHQLRRALDIEFVPDPVAKIFYSLHADLKLVGDVAVLQPPADQLKDLELAVGEAVVGGKIFIVDVA